MAYGYYQPYMYPMQDNLTQLRNQQLQQAQITQPQMSVSNQDERIWVSSPSAAEAYLMAPNSFVRLWDSNQSVFYERRTDSQGRPFPMDTYRYSREDATTRINQFYGDKQDNLNKKIQELEKRLSELEKGIVGGVNDVSESNTDDATVQSI